jgi:hypothetical protein
MVVEHSPAPTRTPSQSRVALTFTAVPWSRNGIYTWSYVEEEEIVRREVSITPAQRAALSIFLRHYFAASMLCGMTDSCRRIGDRLLSLTPLTALEKCWAQALVGISYVQDTVKNFAHDSFFGEGTPDDRREARIRIAPYEAWALHQTYEFFCQDIIPWFVLNDGYPFCDHAALLEEIQAMDFLRSQWNWLSDPYTGYLRIVYNPTERLQD